MRKPLHGFSALASPLLCISFLLSGLPSYVRAQQSSPSPGTARGIQLYEQGDSRAAIELLKVALTRHPDDPYAWYYLGLAFHSQGLIVEARARFQRVIELWPDSADAHAKLAYAILLADQPQNALAMAQRAIELGDQSPEAHYVIAEANLRMRTDALRPGQLPLAVEEAETALRINPNFEPALITKSFALFHLKRYHEAAASLEGFLGIKPDDLDADTWRAQLEQIREQDATSTATPTADATIFTGSTVTQKARVLSKPEPSYTEAARLAGVQGTVVLRAVVASDGTVKNIFVLQDLGYGLTTGAVNAARKIRFQPAVKDGMPVSTYIQFEYNFNLY